MRASMGYGLAVLSAFFLAANSILVKTVYSYGVSPAQVFLMQELIAAALFWVFVAFKRETASVSRRVLIQMLVLGIVGMFSGGFLFYSALNLLGAGLSTMLLFTFPAYVTVATVIFFRERITVAHGISLAMALAGCALALRIFDLDFRNAVLPGVLMGCGAAVACAVMSVYGQHILKRTNPVTLSLYTNTFACIPLLLVQNPLNILKAGYGVQVFGLVAVIALVAGFLPSLLMFSAVRVVGAARASIVSAVELPFTLLMAFFLLGERFSVSQLFGAALIFGGVLLLQFEKMPAASPGEQPAGEKT